MEMTDILKKHFEGIETKFGPLPDKVNEALARLDELEQKTARRGSGGDGELVIRSAGQRFIDDAEVKAFTGNAVIGGRKLSVETKAIISSLTTDADGSAGDLIVPYRDNVVGMPRRRLVVRDLLNVVPITSNAVQYPKLTGSTNSAASVSETAGTEKPQSEMKFDIVTSNVTTIAHWVYAMRQILDDAPQLKGLIDSELLYGLAFVEDNMLLNGAGAGADLTGIYTSATAMSANPAVVATPTFLDVIAFALLQQNNTNLPADGIVLNPADWTKIQTIKDTAGAYILGNPSEQVAQRLWGLPVVTTPAMTVDKGLVGCFQQGATLYDRMSARVEVSTEDGSNFRENKVTVLAEERIALGIKYATGFTKFDFSDAITDLTS